MTTTIESTSQPGSDGSGKPRKQPPAVPPEWPAEIFVKKIGRFTGALGRGLDRAAKLPVIGWVVRRLSSVWLGISVLALIGLYIAIGSGRPDIRARLEMTDLQFFDAWPMRILLALLAVDLIFVTLRRIPLTLFKLGSWTVHVGILTLITGCVIYFSLKQEGGARFYLNKPVTYWYDNNERALYSFPLKSDGTFDTEHPTITPIPALPIYFERLAQDPYNNPLNLSLPGAIQAGGPVDVSVVGYYPFAAMEVAAYRAPEVDAEPSLGPAVSLTLATARDSMPDMWLQSDSPHERAFELQQPFTLEFLNRPSAQRLHDLQTSFEARGAVTVRVPKLKVEKTIAINGPEVIGTPIPIEGTPYTITIEDGGDIPMRSVGYEGTHSTNLMIAVSRKDGDKTFDFKRMSLSRYPERSPDFVMENEKQTRKQDGVDHDIDIIFHDASRTNAWIVETEDAGDKPKLQAIIRTTDGKSVTRDIEMNKPIDVKVDGIPGMKMTLTKHLEKSVAMKQPRIIPVEQRPRSLTSMEVMRFSAVEVAINAPGGVRKAYVPFALYGAVNDPDGTVPTIVNIPGKGLVGLLLSTARRDLPTTATLTDFKPVKFDGATRAYMDYFSTVKFDDGNGAETKVAHLNHPVYDKGLIYFQSQWDGDDKAPPDKRFSVLGIANRPGMWVMIVGSVLMAMGIGYAFYIKPFLLKHKKESLAAWNAARLGGAAPARG